MGYIRFIELCSLSLFFGVLLCLEVGRRIGIWRSAHAAEGTAAEGRVVEGVVFGLLGLLMAFTFSGAAARFDTRRQLIVGETNAIGTAYLRLDLLPTAAQPAFRARFRQYVEARLEVYRSCRTLPQHKQQRPEPRSCRGTSGARRSRPARRQVRNTRRCYSCRH